MLLKDTFSWSFKVAREKKKRRRRKQKQRDEEVTIISSFHALPMMTITSRLYIIIILKKRERMLSRLLRSSACSSNIISAPLIYLFFFTTRAWTMWQQTKKNKRRQMLTVCVRDYKLDRDSFFFQCQKKKNKAKKNADIKRFPGVITVRYLTKKKMILFIFFLSFADWNLPPNLYRYDWLASSDFNLWAVIHRYFSHKKRQERCEMM